MPQFDLARTQAVLHQIAERRQRQIAKGFDATHDDTVNEHGALGIAAAALLLDDPDRLPENWGAWVVTDHRDERERVLIVASLAVAYLEQLDRQTEEAEDAESARQHRGDE